MMITLSIFFSILEEKTMRNARKILINFPHFVFISSIALSTRRTSCILFFTSMALCNEFGALRNSNGITKLLRAKILKETKKKIN